LGLGAGMGFIYWHMKGNPESGIPEYVFVGGRGNNKGFFQDLGKRTGVKIAIKSTSSVKKAEQSLLAKLSMKEPVIVYGDMWFLPWFDFPQEYHFGGHTFVICGFDGKETVLASDMDPKANGLKKGFYFPITLEQLRKARNSSYKPFPPKNTYLDFDFSQYRPPGVKDIYSAIHQTAESQLNPPIKNIGVKGIRYTAKEIVKWPHIFRDYDLRMNLFSIYLFIEIGGTGGGCFRYMYSRFLKESADITNNKQLLTMAEKIEESGDIFTQIGLLFVDAERDPKIRDKINIASEKFKRIADIEEEAFNRLSIITK
jgi:hypothetical protein